MATLANDPNQNQNQQNQDNLNQPVNVSGNAANSDTPKAPSSPATPTSSGRFNNLQNYIKANQGNNLAGQMYNNFNQQASQYKNDLGQAQQNFNQQAQKNRVQYDQNFVNNSLQNPTGLTQDQMARFQQERDAQYNGPKSVDQTGQLHGNAQNYQDMANQTQTEGGRFNLLSQMFNRPSYSQGQQSLDNLFLQADPNQLNQLQQSRSLANNVNAQTNSATAQSQADAANYANEAQQTRQNTRDALNNSITGFDTDISQRVSDAQKASSDAYAKAKSLAAQGLMSDADLQRFGIAPNTSFYDLNLNNYLTDPTGTANKQNVATSDDYNRIAALGNLAGNTAQGDVANILDQYKDASQAGKFDKNSYGFDLNKFNTDLGGIQSDINNQLQPYQHSIDEANSALQGNLYYQGGIQGQLHDLASGLSGGVGQTTGQSDAERIRQYLQNPYSNNAVFNAESPEQRADTIKTTEATDPKMQQLQKLLGQYDFEQNKLNDSQSKFNALKNTLHNPQHRINGMLGK